MFCNLLFGLTQNILAGNYIGRFADSSGRFMAIIHFNDTSSLMLIPCPDRKISAWPSSSSSSG
jgi:hypothetical protein